MGTATSGPMGFTGMAGSEKPEHRCPISDARARRVSARSAGGRARLGGGDVFQMKRERVEGEGIGGAGKRKEEGSPGSGRRTSGIASGRGKA